MRKIDDANKEVHDGITNFEQTLRNKGISVKVSKEEADRAVMDSLTGSPMKATQKV